METSKLAPAPTAGTGLKTSSSSHHRTSLALMGLLLLLALGCSSQRSANRQAQQRARQFTAELQQLQRYFHLPGLSVTVRQQGKVTYQANLGQADLDRNIPTGPQTVYPMASLTKLFTAVAILQLAEAGKLRLDEPINRYVSKPLIPDSITIRHVLSHTSQGKVGHHFYYSGRFGWLTTVIAKASGQSYQQQLQTGIIQPLGLQHTYLLQDSAQVQARGEQLAQPYLYEGKTLPGHIEYGFSASAGINATTGDLALFAEALQQGRLISQQSLQALLKPQAPQLPYGLGIFSQQFQGRQLHWAFGQYDCYSSLLLQLPEQQTTLVIAANNNLLSDPARLIYGDVGYSLFALSFLKHFALDLRAPLLEDSLSIAQTAPASWAANPEFYRKKLVAQALAEGFLSAYQDRENPLAPKLLEKTFAQFPDYQSNADLPLLHSLSFLKSVASHKGRPNFSTFDDQLEQIGLQLLARDPDNPYAHTYLAGLYASKGQNDSARKHYRHLLEAKNFSKNWYTNEASDWLRTNPR